jgi:hypothetical protein
MSVASLRTTVTLRAAGGLAIGRRVGRWLLAGLGYGLIAVGAVFAVLPGHLGAPVLATGLVIALRSSPRARRRFIEAQRRHPKVLFPVRRLLRREPEVIPVAWQTLLRAERVLLPKTWRFAVRLRRSFRPR